MPDLLRKCPASERCGRVSDCYSSVCTQSSGPGNRGARIHTSCAVVSAPTLDRAFARLLEPYSLSGGGYLNYPEVDQTPSRVAAAFGPERLAKLREIKRTWDPDNRFRHNANIAPA